MWKFLVFLIILKVLHGSSSPLVEQLPCQAFTLESSGNFVICFFLPNKIHNDVIDSIGITNLNNEINDQEVLQVDFSKVKSAGIPNSIFQKFRKLKLFKSTKSQIASISTNTFLNVGNLENVNLVDNVITKLSNNTFFETTELRELHLSGNQISEIELLAFNNLEKLEILSLSRNQLHNLNELIFTPLINLETINLNRNQIQHLPARLFTSNTHLKTLHLAKNQITSVTSSRMFVNLYSLNFVALAGNICIDQNYYPQESNLIVNHLQNCVTSESSES